VGISAVPRTPESSPQLSSSPSRPLARLELSVSHSPFASRDRVVFSLLAFRGTLRDVVLRSLLPFIQYQSTYKKRKKRVIRVC
jgi:hypothetical protein